MQDYRLYVIDGGELRWPREIRASDDAAAIDLARHQCLDGRRMELWQARRKVHCWGFDDCPSQCGPATAH